MDRAIEAMMAGETRIAFTICASDIKPDKISDWLFHISEQEIRFPSTTEYKRQRCLEILSSEGFTDGYNDEIEVLLAHILYEEARNGETVEPGKAE